MSVHPKFFLIFALITGFWAGYANAAVDRDRSQQFYERALQHFNEDGYTAATIELRNALQQDPKNLPARILLGETLLREDQPFAAIKELQTALSLGGDENLILVPLANAFLETAQPEMVITNVVAEGHTPDVDGELHLLQARAYTMMSNRKLAEESYLSAGTLMPADPRPLIGRAGIELSKRKFKKANKLIQQAIGLAPDSFDVWLFTALAYRDVGQPADALAAFGRALQLRPTSARALAGRAALWLDLGRVAEAKEDLQKAEDLEVDTLETIYLRTLLMFREGQVEEARQLLRRSADDIRAVAEDVRSKLSNTDLMLGVVAYFEENYEEAVSHLQTFLKQNSIHPGAKKYLAASFLALKEWNQAIRVYRKGPNSKAPEDPTALSMLAEAYRSKGDYKSAEKYFEAALELAPGMATVGINLAMSRLDAGKPEQALKELEWFAKTFPDLLEARLQLARVYVRLERFEEAVEVLKMAVAEHSDKPLVHNTAGAVYLAAGNAYKAREHLKLANSIDQTSIMPRLNLARLDRMEGNIEAAEIQYRGLLEDYPFHVESGIELAEILRQQGEVDEAAERIAQVLKTKPDLFKAHALNLQLLLDAREDEDRIRDNTYKLLKRFESDPQAAYLAGQILAGLGDREDARARFRFAVQQAQFDSALLISIATQQIAIRDLSGALWALTKALQGNPNDLDAALTKADVFIQLDDFDNAKSLLDDIEAQHGVGPGLLMKRGDLAMALADIDTGASFFRQAYDMVKNPLTVRTYFSSLALRGDIDAAVPLMDRWLKDYPRDADSRNLFAETLMRNKQFVAARKHYEILVESGLTSVVLLNNLAMVYQSLGDPRAIETAKTAHEKAPDAWSVLDTYGWILTQSGEPEEGLAMLRDAFARSSTSPEVRYHIGVALTKMGRHKEALNEIDAALNEGRSFLGEEDARSLRSRLAKEVESDS